MFVPGNNHATETHERQAQSCRRREWAAGRGRKGGKRPVQIHKVAALAPRRALLKGDKAVGGTCVWWESQNPAGSPVSPSEALLGTPALFVELSVTQEVFTGTWASRLVVGTHARPNLSLFYWFIWSLFQCGSQSCHLCCVKHSREMFRTATPMRFNQLTCFMVALELGHNLRHIFISKLLFLQAGNLFFGAGR